jgi:hypothetical protein
MSDTSIDEPATQPAASAPPEDGGVLERAKNSVIHAVEAVVEKVTDTAGHLGGRR